MAGLGVGVVATFVQSMLDHGLEKTLEKKLEGLGEDFVMSFLAGPFGTAQRIATGIKTGGMSEFENLGEDWLSNFKPRPMTDSPLVNKIISAAYTPLHRRIHGEHSARSRAAWGRTDWARSRDDWLDNHWRHDWRSQPRNAQGRWIPGRLQYIEASMQYRSRRIGRSRRRKLQLRRMSRARGRKAARQLFKQLRKEHAG